MLVSEPNQRSSGGNTLSTPHVSVPTLRPAYNGVDRYVHGNNSFRIRSILDINHAVVRSTIALYNTSCLNTFCLRCHFRHIFMFSENGDSKLRIYMGHTYSMPMPHQQICGTRRQYHFRALYTSLHSLSIICRMWFSCVIQINRREYLLSDKHELNGKM